MSYYLKYVAWLVVAAAFSLYRKESWLEALGRFVFITALFLISKKLGWI